MSHKLPLPLPLPLLLTLLLTSCLSMSEDVLPPPGYQQPTAAPQLTLTVEAVATTDAAADEAATPRDTPHATQTSAASAPESESAAEASDGVGLISVALVNGSGGEVPIGAEVVLHGFDEMEEVYTRTLALPEDGVAIFEAVPMPAGRVYLASTEYDQVGYGSDLAQIGADTSEASLEIVVFDATTDISVLAIERLHVFFDFGDDGIVQVIELILLSNSSGKTLVSPDDGAPVLVFEIPEGAANFGFRENMNLRYLQTQTGLGIGSVRPAAEPYEVTFAFEMPYLDKTLDMALPIPLDIASASVIAPQDGVKVESDQLQDIETRDFQGVAYQSYSSSTGLSRGDTLRFSLSGSPALPAEQVSSDDTDIADTDKTGLIIGLTVFGVTLISAGIYLWSRKLGTRD